MDVKADHVILFFTVALLFFSFTTGFFYRSSVELKTERDDLHTFLIQTNDRFERLQENYTDLSFEKSSIGFYNDSNKCLLILEQQVACFHGCHDFLLLLHDRGYDWLVIKNVHDECISFCEGRYNVSFNEWGDVENCSYCEDW